MAERWEHMIIRTLGPQMALISPDGTVNPLSGGAQMGDILREMNRLGREGWHLIDVVADAGSYWMKRRLE